MDHKRQLEDAHDLPELTKIDSEWDSSHKRIRSETERSKLKIKDDGPGSVGLQRMVYSCCDPREHGGETLGIMEQRG
jgi:hypothetical protein